MLAPIDVRLEVHTFIGHLPEFIQREDLITTAIGKNRAIPMRELVDAACFFNELMSRSQIEMIRVAEYELSTRALDLSRGEGLHRGQRTDGHEDGRLDRPMRCRQ